MLLYILLHHLQKLTDCTLQSSWRLFVILRREKYVLMPFLRRSLLRQAGPQWKVLVLDDASRKLVDSVVKEDDILEENVTSMPARCGFPPNSLTLY